MPILSVGELADAARYHTDHRSSSRAAAGLITTTITSPMPVDATPSPVVRAMESHAAEGQMAAAARLFQPRSSSNPASGTNTNSTSPSSTPSNRDRDSLVFFFDVSAPLLCIPCPGILVFMCGLSLSPATQVKKTGSDRSGYAKFSNSQNVNLVRFFRSSKGRQAESCRRTLAAGKAKQGDEV